MDYTLHQLKIFLKVVHKKSITKAAEELHLTQPAVSIQLKKLQEQFDIALIEIIGKQLYITDFGLEIAEASQRILDEVYEIKNKTLAYKGYMVGQLKISVVSTGKYVMPYFLSDFLQAHPGVELTMDVTNKSRVMESILQNEVDFALVSVVPDTFQVNRIELMQNKLFMVRKFEASNSSKSLKQKDIEKFPFIFRERGSATRQAMEKFIAGFNIPLKKTIELTSNEAVKQAVIAGLGYSLMPLIGIKNELMNTDLEIVKIKELPITTHWNLIWLPDKKLSPIATSYLNYLEEHKGSIIHNTFSWYEKY